MGLNIAATYLRSVLALFCAVFTSRWLLAALGTQQYGVFGVIGVILGLVGTVNSILSCSVSRYFAYSVGRAQTMQNAQDGILESCQWFNSAIVIHTAFAVGILLVGYPLGFWAIKYYFNIPPPLVASSLWVFSFSMVTVFFGMITVPFMALYNAHQMIAEVTIYSIFTTVFNVVFAWILLGYSGDRLRFNGLYSMVLTVLPNIIIAIRAFWIFPECRIRPRLMLNATCYKNLFSFAGWQIVGWIGFIMRFQGLTTLCNKVLGLTYNSSLAVANSLSQQAATFSNALNGAFTPAITNAAGAKDTPLFEALVLRSSKLGTIMCAVFILPLCMEIHYVVHLWLVNPPPCVEDLCIITLLTYIVERSSTGYGSAVAAHGDMKGIQITICVIWSFSLVLGWLFLCVWHTGVVGIAWSVFICTWLWSAAHLYFARRQTGIRLMPWLTKFVIPFLLVSTVSVVPTLVLRFHMEESFLRLVLSTTLCVSVFMMGCIRFVCDEHERVYLKQQVKRRLPMLLKGGR